MDEAGKKFPDRYSVELVMEVVYTRSLPCFGSSLIDALIFSWVITPPGSARQGSESNAHCGAACVPEHL